MTVYYDYGVSLSDGQRRKLAKAIGDRSEITLRLSHDELTGGDKMMLTKTQIAKLQKARAQGRGADLKITKTQIRSMVQRGGSLIASLMSLGTRALPMVTKFASKVLPGLAQGALSSLGNFSMDKILGQGQVGGFIIPPASLGALQQIMPLLSSKQINNMNDAISKSAYFVLKPTKKLQGGALGLLASIGIPLLLNALTGKGLQNRKPPSGGRGLQNRPPPKKKGGKGLQNRKPPSGGCVDCKSGMGLQNRPPPKKKG